MIRIEHVAIWVHDLEKMKIFYTTYFGAVANERYYNPKKEFYSYFLSFTSGCRLELMTIPGIRSSAQNPADHIHGLTHLAIAVECQADVVALTERIRKDGYAVVGEPRTTGDGYFESVILDPEGNRIEITC
jgi:lactoylglutathione lyase